MNDQFIEELYGKYYEELHRYCAMQFHFAPAYMPTVDDIVQEVFIKAYRNQKELLTHDSKMGWLCIECHSGGFSFSMFSNLETGCTLTSESRVQDVPMWSSGLWSGAMMALPERST